MPSIFKHFGINLISWFMISVFFFIICQIWPNNIRIPLIFDEIWQNGWIFLIGGFVFDIDHAFYFIWTTRPLKFSNILQRHHIDFASSNPHPFVFHSIEFIIFFLIIFVIFENIALLFLNLGWIVHMITDITDYWQKYHSSKPWLKYFSLFRIGWDYYTL